MVTKISTPNWGLNRTEVDFTEDLLDKGSSRQNPSLSLIFIPST